MILLRACAYLGICKQPQAADFSASIDPDAHAAWLISASAMKVAACVVGLNIVILVLLSEGRQFKSAATLSGIPSASL